MKKCCTSIATSLNIYHQKRIGSVPESKVHGANMGPIWGRQDPDGPHVGPLNFAIWGTIYVALAITHPTTFVRISLRYDISVNIIAYPCYRQWRINDSIGVK